MEVIKIHLPEIHSVLETDYKKILFVSAHTIITCEHVNIL